MTTSFFAPAKINLALHVTGQRADGYHLLDSLVVFVDRGDRVRVMPADRMSMRVTGPMAAGVPTDASNLAWRAADWFGTPPVSITLEKHLPSAAGIGGGSSDAAAALRALAACFERDLPRAADTATLGADVPVCLTPQPCRMSGMGEIIGAVPSMPPVHLVLVNPGMAVPTPQVFATLGNKENPPMAEMPNWPDTATLASWLHRQRNDLELPARAIEPAIGVALALLHAGGGCLLARMSGSGATCFGLFATRPEAEAKAVDIAEAHPDWWVRPASTLTSIVDS